MTLLLTSGWQGVGIALTVLLLLPGIYFSWVSWKASKSGQTQQAHPGSPGVKEFKENTPFYKVNSFKYAVAFFAAYIIGMGILISDYSSKVPKRIPQQQNDTTRQAAEDMVKPVVDNDTVPVLKIKPKSDILFDESRPDHFYPFIIYSENRITGVITECKVDMITGKWVLTGDTGLALKEIAKIVYELQKKVPMEYDDPSPLKWTTYKKPIFSFDKL